MPGFLPRFPLSTLLQFSVHCIVDDRSADCYRQRMYHIRLVDRRLILQSDFPLLACVCLDGTKFSVWSICVRRSLSRHSNEKRDVERLW